MSQPENPLDRVADMGADNLMSSVERIPESAEPFASQKLNRMEQLERYDLIRENPQPWLLLIQEHGMQAVARGAATLEKRWQEAQEEAGG